MPIVGVEGYPARFRYRHCPLCGTPLVRVTDDHLERLACPADGWVHYPTANVAATTLVEHDGGVVLLRRAIPPDVGIWHLPIGHLEYGEPPAEGARREAEEETGLVLEPPAFLDFEFSPSYGDPKLMYLVFAYRSRSCGGALGVDHENDAIRVCPADALPELKWTSQRRAVAAWRAWREGRPWTPGQPLTGG
jgi:ADP-ribose pyrophosphatase YjhB (NUDIX family)